MPNGLSIEALLAGLRAAGEPTRLRLLALLSVGELNVKDLTRILGQSQPRISRHLKLLTDAGLIERFREGSWVYFRLNDGEGAANIAKQILSVISPDDAVINRDRDRADAVKLERVQAAQAYFKEHAPEWDRIRTLHLAEEQVEAKMIELLGCGPFDMFVDLGTGTGRILELFSSTFKRGIGIDISHDMLAYARGKLERPELDHCQVRHGDLFNLPLADESADAVVIHQVLHFLDEPYGALAEASRILKPGGQLLVVDFAPHELEFLRDEFAHRRLGFSSDQMRQWIKDSSCEIANHIELKPQKKGEKNKLTVSIWLAAKNKPSSSGEKKRNHRQLEAIS